jgi:hypothetical protein
MSLEPIAVELASVPSIVAALSEGQRAIAHLIVLLAVPVIVGLVLLIRKVRRPDHTRERQRIPEEER